jgi:hypothetical protein
MSIAKLFPFIFYFLNFLFSHSQLRCISVFPRFSKGYTLAFGQKSSTDDTPGNRAVTQPDYPSAYQPPPPKLVYVGDQAPVREPAAAPPHYLELQPRPAPTSAPAQQQQQQQPPIRYSCHACGDGSYFPDAASLVIHQVMVHGRAVPDVDEQHRNNGGIESRASTGVNKPPPGGWSFVSCPECPCR